MLPTVLAFFLSAATLAADTTPRWAQVSVGHDHACALDAAGRAFCWGNNHAAQLGARTPERCGIVGESGHRSCYPTASDTPVAAGGAMRFQSISAGRSRTCGLSSSGHAFCWGAEASGPTGTCMTGTPCGALPLPYEPARRFRTLVVGSRVTCGIGVDGEALCSNVLRGDRWWELRALQPVRPGSRAGDVDAFADWPTENVCVVDERGAAWCRGSNRTGQLGTGTASAEPVDSLVRVAGGVRFRRVVVQDGWMCGLDTGGRAYCWGLRSSKEYFQGDPPGGCDRRACATAPVPVAGALRFLDISAHHRRVCGLTTAGEAYCWGPTEGAASASESADYAPVRVQPDLRFRSLAGNVELGSGSCGITVDGALLCWGVANRPPGRTRILHPPER
jgi:Regulator of chromosome condensation (RCC1) repeat